MAQQEEGQQPSPMMGVHMRNWALAAVALMSVIVAILQLVLK